MRAREGENSLHFTKVMPRKPIYGMYQDQTSLFSVCSFVASVGFGLALPLDHRRLSRRRRRLPRRLLFPFPRRFPLRFVLTRNSPFICRPTGVYPSALKPILLKRN